LPAANFESNIDDGNTWSNAKDVNEFDFRINPKNDIKIVNFPTLTFI